MTHQTRQYLDERFDRLERLMRRILKQERQQTMKLQDIEDKVTEEGQVVDGAVVLLGDLSKLIRDSANDPAEITKIADSLDAQKQKLADAIVANTPAAQA